MKINKDIRRLVLHDSHFEKEFRIADSLEITFDWAKFENLKALGIDDFVVLGKTVLTIKGIKNEKLKAFYEGKNYKLIDFPENIGRYWNEVQNTTIDDTSKTIQLDGLFTKDGENFWIEWSLNFETCEVEWNSYVTGNEWKNGKLPSD